MGCVAGAGGGCGLATNWGRLEMTGGGAGASRGLVKAVGVAASPGPSWVTALTGLTPGTPATGAAGKGVASTGRGAARGTVGVEGEGVMGANTALAAAEWAGEVGSEKAVAGRMGGSWGDTGGGQPGSGSEELLCARTCCEITRGKWPASGTGGGRMEAVLMAGPGSAARLTASIMEVMGASFMSGACCASVACSSVGSAAAVPSMLVVSTEMLLAAFSGTSLVSRDT